MRVVVVVLLLLLLLLLCGFMVDGGLYSDPNGVWRMATGMRRG